MASNVWRFTAAFVAIAESLVSLFQKTELVACEKILLGLYRSCALLCLSYRKSCATFPFFSWQGFRSKARLIFCSFLSFPFSYFSFLSGPTKPGFTKAPVLGSNSLVLSKHVADLLNSVISVAHILVAMFSDCRL